MMTMQQLEDRVRNLEEARFAVVNVHAGNDQVVRPEYTDWHEAHGRMLAQRRVNFRYEGSIRILDYSTVPPTDVSNREPQ